MSSNVGESQKLHEALLLRKVASMSAPLASFQYAKTRVPKVRKSLERQIR